MGVGMTALFDEESGAQIPCTLIGFTRGLMTHGSKSHREHGSTGPGATPSRVYPGMKHPGRMGGKTTTVQNLKILKVEGNYVAIAGSVPGKKGNLLSITKAKGGYSPN